MKHNAPVTDESGDRPRRKAEVPWPGLVPAPGASIVTILACLPSRLSCAASPTRVASAANTVIAVIEIDSLSFTLPGFRGFPSYTC